MSKVKVVIAEISKDTEGQEVEDLLNTNLKHLQNHKIINISQVVYPISTKKESYNLYTTFLYE